MRRTHTGWNETRYLLSREVTNKKSQRWRLRGDVCKRCRCRKSTVVRTRRVGKLPPYCFSSALHYCLLAPEVEKRSHKTCSLLYENQWNVWMCARTGVRTANVPFSLFTLYLFKKKILDESWVKKRSVLLTVRHETGRATAVSCLFWLGEKGGRRRIVSDSTALGLARRASFPPGLLPLLLSLL